MNAFLGCVTRWMLVTLWLFGALHRSGKLRNEKYFKFVYSGNSLLDTVEIGV